MNRSEIVAALSTVMKETQLLSGREWHPVDGKAKPIGALDGFDSLCGLEATLMLEEKLGCSFGDDSIFVSHDGTRALSVSEITDRVASVVSVR